MAILDCLPFFVVPTGWILFTYFVNSPSPSPASLAIAEITLLCAGNQDEENNFEIVVDLHEESDFQIGKENDLNNDVSFIYVHKILFIASRCKNNFRAVFVRKDFLQICLACAPSFLA